jgi:hypothetical protein
VWVERVFSCPKWATYFTANLGLISRIALSIPTRKHLFPYTEVGFISEVAGISERGGLCGLGKEI